jgi:hypothetical protein
MGEATDENCSMVEMEQEDDAPPPPVAVEEAEANAGRLKSSGFEEPP